MKNKILLFYLIPIVVILSNCAGYEPIFTTKNLDFKVSNYEIEGNKNLGKKIYSKIYGISKPKNTNNDIKELSIYINVKKDKAPTSKSSSGKILEYNISLNSQIKINEYASDKVILNKSFNVSERYKAQAQYSDTIKLENKTVENLIERIYQTLLVELSEKI